MDTKSIDRTVTMVYRIYVVVDGRKHWEKGSMGQQELGQTRIGAA